MTRTRFKAPAGRRHTPFAYALAFTPLLFALSGCGGGGGGGSGGPQATTLSASGLAYSRSMTITVNGSGLNDSGLQMTVDGPCGTVTRAQGATDSQVQFSCQVVGVGELTPRVRTSNGDEIGRLKVSVPTPQVLMAVSQGDRSGSMLVEIDPAAAPVTALNFMNYVATGFYTSTLIHRVVAGTLAQGGGYVEGPLPKAPTRDAIPLENTGLRNLRGTIAMARTPFPNSATSQFYFNIKDNPDFDRVDDANPGYAVFGRILTGLDVLDEIGKVNTEALNTALPSFPLPQVTVTAVLQVR